MSLREEHFLDYSVLDKIHLYYTVINGRSKSADGAGTQSWDFSKALKESTEVFNAQDVQDDHQSVQNMCPGCSFFPINAQCV